MFSCLLLCPSFRQAGDWLENTVVVSQGKTGPSPAAGVLPCPCLETVLTCDPQTEHWRLLKPRSDSPERSVQTGPSLGSAPATFGLFQFHSRCHQLQQCRNLWRSEKQITVLSLPCNRMSRFREALFFSWTGPKTVISCNSS